MCTEVCLTKRRAFLRWIGMLLMCILFITPAARAESPVSVIAALVPGDFLAPGEATLTVELKNNGKKVAENMRVSPNENTAGDAVEILQPGTTSYYAYGVTVSQETLNTGYVDVFVSYRMDGKTYKERVRAQAVQVTRLAEVRFIRSLSKSTLRAGDRVEVSYYVINTGDVSIQDARVSDALGEYVSETFSLAPGAMWEARNYATVAETISAAARISFLSGETGSSYSEYSNRAEVTTDKDGVNFTASASGDTAFYGERARVTLRVENTGAFSYRSLVIEEPSLGQILGAPSSLRPGESFEVEAQTPPLTEDAEYAFTLSMRCDDGTALRYQAPAVNVRVAGEAEGEVSLRAEPRAQDESPKGEAAFSVQIRSASRNLYNVTVGEKNAGALRALAVLPAGAETDLTLRVNAASGDACQFYVSYEENGETHTRYAQVAYAGDVSPEATNAPGQKQAALYAVVRMANLPVGVLIGCGAILLGACAYWAFQLRARRKSAQRARKRQDEIGKTNKFARVRAAGEAKESK